MNVYLLIRMIQREGHLDSGDGERPSPGAGRCWVSRVTLSSYHEGKEYGTVAVGS